MASHKLNPRLAVIVLAGLLTGLLTVGGCGKTEHAVPAAGKIVKGTVGEARLLTIPRVLTATGALEAETTVTVSTRMMGWVKKLQAVEGRRVRKGDPLVTIDGSDLRAKRAQAEAGIAEAEAVLANAQTMLARFENLYADKSVSKQQLDDVRTGRDRAAAGLDMAKAGLREVNVHLSYLDIVAPADGIVARTMVEPGDMANPGMPLVILQDADRMKVVAQVGEKDVADVQAGDSVTVDVTSLPGAVYAAVLERVVPAANPGSRTYDIEALIDNADGRLRSGMFARVKVPVDVRRAVLVPQSALVRRGQLTGVWVVDQEQIVRLRWVRLGGQQGEAYEVLAGLDGGEAIVLSHEMPLAEGDKVVR